MKMKLLFVLLLSIGILFSPNPGHSTIYYKQLSMSKFYQLKSKWCWAAVCQTIRNYNKNFYRWQCKMAAALSSSYLANDKLCCGPNGEYESNTPYPDPIRDAFCNQGQYLSTSMKWNGIYQSKHSGLLSNNAIKIEIDALRPIAIHVDWDSGSAHAIMIYGYHFDTSLLVHRFYIWDPYTGSQYLSQSALESYGGGTIKACFKSTR